MGEMPPKNKKRPDVIRRLEFSDWIVQQLQNEMKDKGGFKAHLDPKKANYLEHDLLFGDLPNGIKLKPTSSPARIWRITPQEHITRLNELINREPAYDLLSPGFAPGEILFPPIMEVSLNLFWYRSYYSLGGRNVAYQTAVKSIPVVLSSNRKHGFENYADFIP